jgi:hypothetical protein
MLFLESKRIRKRKPRDVAYTCCDRIRNSVMMADDLCRILLRRVILPKTENFEVQKGFTKLPGNLTCLKGCTRYTMYTSFETVG